MPQDEAKPPASGPALGPNGRPVARAKPRPAPPAPRPSDDDEDDDDDDEPPARASAPAGTGTGTGARADDGEPASPPTMSWTAPPGWADPKPAPGVYGAFRPRDSRGPSQPPASKPRAVPLARPPEERRPAPTVQGFGPAPRPTARRAEDDDEDAPARPTPVRAPAPAPPPPKPRRPMISEVSSTPGLGTPPKTAPAAKPPAPAVPPPAPRLPTPRATVVPAPAPRPSDRELLAKLRADLSLVRKQAQIPVEIRLDSERWNALSPDMRVGPFGGRSVPLFDGLPCVLVVGLQQSGGYSIRSIEPKNP